MVRRGRGVRGVTGFLFSGNSPKNVFDAIYGAAACTFIETDHVLGVVVADGLQVAELSLAGGFIQKRMRIGYRLLLLLFVQRNLLFCHLSASR